MESKDVYAELSSIKNIMERSTRFISLSGLAGVMAGIYALAGAGVAYQLLNNGPADVQLLVAVALGVLVISMGTAIWLSYRKASKKGQSIWTQSSKALLFAGMVPLVTGGCFTLMILSQGNYELIAPCCLIFYGLSVVSASKYTFGDVKWLGILEILLGLIATLLPGYGLLFWALGFGVLHIIYGTIMHFKYDRESIAQ
ncbi:hypothetical protein MUY27_05515 [Mucilaginibacter sp. RS28]|uniref:Uncharacterized protein n=1 Tax=Mucilaginibacter straminoryzae TaxID=2932774 RepID=A0A9X1X1L6_9SPHI|nr:hypothetical protein [Mucilaginibacter straminoryzae]MCJ8209156.1 hypothetical protein [Mucilaginibacter straminoryzae]